MFHMRHFDIYYLQSLLQCKNFFVFHVACPADGIHRAAILIQNQANLFIIFNRKIDLIAPSVF
jgi:hypothetical protein